MCLCVCVFFLVFCVFLLLTQCLRCCDAKEGKEASGVAVAHGRLSARDGGGGRRRRRTRTRTTTRATRRRGGVFWKGELVGGSWKQELTGCKGKKKYKVSLHLLIISVAGHARDVAPGLEHDFGDAGRKCIVSSSTATAAAAAGGPHAGGALVPFNSGVELRCGIVIFMFCCCCSHDSSG